MISAYIASKLCHVEGDPHVHLGEEYAVYAITFERTHSGMVAITQHVSLSKVLTDEKGNFIANEIPILCGVIFTSLDDVRFLHVDTVWELIRQGNDLYCRETTHKLTTIQQQLLDDPRKGTDDV